MYKLLGKYVGSPKQDVEFEVRTAPNFKSEKYGYKLMDALGDSAFLEKLETKILGRITSGDILGLSRNLRNMLHK